METENKLETGMILGLQGKIIEDRKKSEGKIVFTEI